MLHATTDATCSIKCKTCIHARSNATCNNACYMQHHMQNIYTCHVKCYMQQRMLHATTHATCSITCKTYIHARSNATCNNACYMQLYMRMLAACMLLKVCKRVLSLSSLTASWTVAPCFLFELTKHSSQGLGPCCHMCKHRIPMQRQCVESQAP